MKLGSLLLQCIAVTTPVMAAINIFLVSKDPNFAGESTNSQYPKSIELIDATFGESNVFSFASGPGKASFDNFVITKKLDRSSPNIMTYIAMGNNIQTFTIYFQKAGGSSGTAQTFRTLNFTNVILLDYNWTTSGSDVTPTESVAFAYGKVSDTYRIQNPNGTLGATVTGCWAPANNSPC